MMDDVRRWLEGKEAEAHARLIEAAAHRMAELAEQSGEPLRLRRRRRRRRIRAMLRQPNRVPQSRHERWLAAEVKYSAHLAKMRTDLGYDDPRQPEG